MTDTLESERLLMRRWKAEDGEPFHALNSDPAVMEFLPSLLSRQESDAMISRCDSHFEEHGFGAWALELKEGGTLIGYTGLVVPGFQAAFTPCVEIGWRLARDCFIHRTGQPSVDRRNDAAWDDRAAGRGFRPP